MATCESKNALCGIPQALSICTMSLESISQSQIDLREAESDPPALLHSVISNLFTIGVSVTSHVHRSVLVMLLFCSVSGKNIKLPP